MKTGMSRSRVTLAGKGKPSTEQQKKRIASGQDIQVDPLAFALPPWPEWSDTELNAERWEAVSHPPAHKFPEKQRGSVISGIALLGFQDPMGHVPVPSSLKVDSWSRLVGIPNLTVVDHTSSDAPLLDLVTPNTHLLHSEVMRRILAGIMSLYKLGRSSNMHLEGEGNDFTSPSGHWKPWYHVYANCKVGKGVPHKPLPNTYGKYIVRLFYMGCWRRITVDDHIPLDREKRPLLPMTKSPTEVWLALLTKALLKVASLSWNEEAEVRDFSVIGCLTGWHAQVLNMHQVPSRTIWWLCQKLLMADNEDPELRFSGVKDYVVSHAYETSTVYCPLPSIQCASVGSDLTDPKAEVFGSVMLCAVLDTEGKTEQFSEHPVLLTEARVFLHGDEDRPPTPLWKTFRWKKWALEQGIIMDESMKFVKGIRMFSPLQKVESDANSLLAEATTLACQVKKSGLLKGKSEEFKRKSEKKSVKSEMSKYEVKKEETFDPECWIEFDNLARRIKSLEIYYRTTSFEHNLKVTDMSQLIAEKQPIPTTVSKGGSMKEMRVHSVASLTASNLKKNPLTILYLLVDSVQCKKLLVTISVLKPGITLPVSTSATPDAPYHSSAEFLTGPTAPTYFIMGEEYDWQSHSIGDVQFCLKTVGTVTQLLRLREGLKVFRLWIKLPDVYAVRISSQIPFTVGTRDKIQEVLSSESASWLYYGSNFSSAFNILTKIHLGCAEHKEMLENLCRSYLPVNIPKILAKYATKLRRLMHAKFENALVSLLLEKTEIIDTIVSVVQEWRWMFMRNNFGYKPLIFTPAGEMLAPRSSTKGFSPSLRNLTPPSSFSSHNTIPAELPDDVVSPDNSLSTYRLISIDQRSTMITFDQRSGIEFIRRMIGNDQDILKFYPFRNDDKFLTAFVEYKGISRNSTTRNWLPLVRMIVNTHDDQNPFCSISITTTVTNRVLEVINNDTLEAFPKFLDEIEPSYFPTNRNGYTILAFGNVSDISKVRDHQWKIRIGSVCQEQLPHACSMKTTGECLPVQPPPLTVLEVKDHYIPNKDDIIFKCLLTIQETHPITIRSLTSNKTVEYILRIRDNDEQIIKEYPAIGEKIIPIVRLIGKDEDGPEFFIIEAEVLRKTWSLSSEEKMSVNNLREKDRQALLVYGREEEEKPEPISASISSIMKKTKISVSRGSQESTTTFNLQPDSPFWSLIVVIDENFSSMVSLEKDRREEERIREIKAQWEEADPGRYKKSNQIRQDFLQKKLYCKHEESAEDLISETNFSDELIDISSKESEDILILNESLQSERMNQRNEALQKFEEEYDIIRTEFDNIRWRQSHRHKKHFIHLDEVSLKSREMITNAYNEREKAITRLIEKIEAEKREALLNEAKNRKKGDKAAAKKKK